MSHLPVLNVFLASIDVSVFGRRNLLCTQTMNSRRRNLIRFLQIQFDVNDKINTYTRLIALNNIGISSMCVCVCSSHFRRFQIFILYFIRCHTHITHTRAATKQFNINNNLAMKCTLCVVSDSRRRCYNHTRKRSPYTLLNTER